MSNKNSASDAAPLGPGGAVADFFTLEGTMVDDSALSTDTSIRITVPLVGNQIACPVCEKREIHLFFMTLSDLDRHLYQHHMEARIQWGCLYYERSFPKLHGARFHIPKCSGPSQRKREHTNAKFAP